MKLLYVTARWNPKDPDSGSGVNYQAYTAIKRHVDELAIAGPFDIPLTLSERGVRKIASTITNKRFIKFYPSYIKQSNEVVQKMITDFKPDIIFSKSSIPLVNVDLPVPLIYMCDSSVKWVSENLQHFSKLGLWVMKHWERKVINKASHIITFSDANAEVLQNYYQKPKEMISIYPIPSALPKEVSGYEEKLINANNVLKLLLVGKVYFGKGVDIAIKTTQILNEIGIPTNLRIVGQDGASMPNVSFKGLYSKNDPNELSKYVENYRWAHFLIFPSRFDAAGIVPSEAAGFGVPTITNAAGGLATTVKNGVSGIVLDKHSPPSDYVAVLKHYWNNPDEYLSLCKSTYERYQSELNWEVLGKRLIEIFQDNLKSNQI